MSDSEDFPWSNQLERLNPWVQAMTTLRMPSAKVIGAVASMTQSPRFRPTVPDAGSRSLGMTRPGRHAPYDSSMASNALGRRFWTLWGSFTAANLGDGFSLVAFPLLAVSLTNDARLIAFVSMCRFLAFPLLGLPAGVIIDRFDRRWLAIAAQAGRGSAIGAVALLVWSNEATIPLLAITAFIVGAGEVITDGGLPAVVRAVVDTDQLEHANSRLSASQTVANVFIGPPLSALLFEVDPALPFLLAAGLYVTTILLLATLRGSFRSHAETDEGSLRQRLTRGLSYVWGHPVLRPLALVVAAFSFVGEAGNAIFVVFVTDRLGLSNVQFGLLLTVDAMGAIVMSFLVTRLITRTSHGFSMRFSVVLATAASILFSATTFVPLIVFAMVLSGASHPSWNVVSVTVRQRLVPDAIFGRMMTAYLVIAWGMQPFGALTGGVIAESFGPEWVYVMSAIVIGSLLFFGRPMFRKVNEALAELPEPASAG